MLFEKLLGINSQNFLLFDIVLHLGTLVAVVIVYHKSIWEIIKNPFGEDAQKLVFATLPTIIIALLFKDFFKQSFVVIFWLFFFVFFMVVITVISKN